MRKAGRLAALILVCALAVGCHGSVRITEGEHSTDGTQAHELETPPQFGFVLSEDMRVLEVAESMAAGRAGMRVGDILVAANGTPLSKGAVAAPIIGELAVQQAKDKVATPITVERDGQRRTLHLKLLPSHVTPNPEVDVDTSSGSVISPASKKPTPTPAKGKVYYL